MSLSLETLAQQTQDRIFVSADIKAEPNQQLEIHLPHISLELHCLSDEFQQLCERALVNVAKPQAGAPSLRLVIGNPSTTPSLSLPQWEVQSPGLGEIFENLERNHLNGLYDPEFHSWQCMSVAEAKAFYLLKTAKAFAPWERAFPLRNFLHWSYAAQNRRLLHAATLGLNGSAVLLAGAGGAGKSGTTLSGVLHGLKSCGDDYIGLEFDDGAPKAFPVMRLMKQDKKGLIRLGLDPKNEIFGAENWQHKYEFDFDTLKPNSRADHLSIKAIFLPKIGDSGRTQLRPASGKDAMFALMPNNLQQLPGCFKQGFDIISRLSRSVPSYHLELSRDPQEISDTIAQFLSKAQ